MPNWVKSRLATCYFTYRAVSMGEATKDKYNPAYNHLVSLLDECQQKNAPGYIINGINKALRLIEDRDIYCEAVTTAPSEALNIISKETRAHPWEKLHQQGKTNYYLPPNMVTGKLEGQFLKSLVSMHKAKKVLDIGMYTGYSALACAEVLPEDGVVVSCEAEPYLEELAKSLFSKSPHGQKIQIRIGPAEETLHHLAEEKQVFDVIFIDADKDGYKNIYQIIMDKELLNKGGSIVFDNALFYGEPYSKDCRQDTMPHGWEVKKCNDFIASDSRVHRVLVPLRDGLLIVRRNEDM